MLLGDNSTASAPSAHIITTRSDGFSLNIGGTPCYSVSDIALGMARVGKFEPHHIRIAETYSGYGSQIGDFFNL